MTVTRLRTALGCFVLFSLALVAPAHARRGVRIPLQVRITAFVNEKLEGIKPENLGANVSITSTKYFDELLTQGTKHWTTALACE